MERFIGIDNVCAWPNLTLLPDGAIVATIFNQPTHGEWEGDVECWTSSDDGYTWQLRGVPAPHEPGTNRLIVTAGVAHDGALVVIASGQSHKAPQGQEPPPGEAIILAPWVCRSTDGGRTWERTEGVTPPQGLPDGIPFGDIQRSPDGVLGVSLFSESGNRKWSSFFYRSQDDGYTWGEPTLIAAGRYSETALLCLDQAHWLAAARNQRELQVDLFISRDAGSSWTRRGPLTLPGQHPAHLLRLADGRILLGYGIRNQGLYGVAVRLSDNEGESWGPPRLLVDLEDATDGGYPSSVELKDGIIVTAYYCNHIPAHARYHMGVLRWQLET